MVAMLCSCGQPKSVSSTLSTGDVESLAKSFERLNEVLALKAPQVFTNLAPPATGAEIAKLRGELGDVKIDVIEAWYGWHNGGASPQPVQLLPLGYFLSIDEALADRKAIQKIPLVSSLRKRSIKLLEDGAGDGFFMDPTTPNPGVFYHMLEEPTPIAYGTLKQFVDFIAGCFANGTCFVNEDGRFFFDTVEYDKAEAAFLNALSSP